jgi:hypothetical protein
MTITLSHEQERVLNEVVNLGLATSPEEAIDQAFDVLRERLPFYPDASDDEVAAVARSLAMFGKRNQLSLGGLSIKELLQESRP